jgi:UDP:flavonoid glycosyltransferase YjiC (YdhE family)
MKTGKAYTSSSPVPAIAFFVSPHGFGHATRAGAVMAAIQAQRPAVRCEVFTTAPPWLFTETLPGPLGYHTTHTDVGLVQVTPLEEDLRATLAALDDFYPLGRVQVEGLATRLVELGCRLVVCDIAPLGIAAGRRAGLPVILVENFTWDWIYAGYARDLSGPARQAAHLPGTARQAAHLPGTARHAAHLPGLIRHAAYLRGLFASVDFHIQTEPVCCPARSDLVTAPVSRAARTTRAHVRRALGLRGRRPVVLVSLGGLSADHPALGRLGDYPRIHFLVPSQVPAVQTRDNVTFLPWSGGFFHPDLIWAADAVVTKLGYSTLAEAYCAGTPCGYVTRPRFPEGGPLQAFAEMHMMGIAIAPQSFAGGDWVGCVEELLAMPRLEDRPSGAAQAAAFLLEVLAGEEVLGR